MMADFLMHLKVVEIFVMASEVVSVRLMISLPFGGVTCAGIVILAVRRILPTLKAFQR